MCLAVPGLVLELFEAHGARMGRLSFGGVVKDVCLAYVPEIAVGQYAIVHAGFAISQLDEESARMTLQLFAEAGLLTAEDSEFGSAAPDTAPDIPGPLAIPPPCLRAPDEIPH